jgi:hypothetical protein
MDEILNGQVFKMSFIGTFTKPFIETSNIFCQSQTFLCHYSMIWEPLIALIVGHYAMNISQSINCGRKCDVCRDIEEELLCLDNSAKMG